MITHVLIRGIFAFALLGIIFAYVQSINLEERREPLSLDEIEELKQNISRKCAIQKLNSGEPSRLPNDVNEFLLYVRASKCAMGCSLKEFRVITTDNKLHIDGLSQLSVLFPQINNEDESTTRYINCTTENVIEQCKYLEAEKDECELAWNLWGCISRVCGIDEE